MNSFCITHQVPIILNGQKEDCWETIKQQQWNIDINSIKADFATDEQLKNVSQPLTI